MATTQPKWKNVTFWVLSILVGLAFLGAGAPKLMGSAEMAQNFEKLGLPAWFLIFTGIVEVGGGVLVIIPKTRFYGAGLLLCTMVGAVGSLVRVGAPFTMMIPALVLGILSAIIALNHRPAFLGGATA